MSYTSFLLLRLLPLFGGLLFLVFLRVFPNSQVSLTFIDIFSSLQDLFSSQKSLHLLSPYSIKVPKTFSLILLFFSFLRSSPILYFSLQVPYSQGFSFCEYHYISLMGFAHQKRFVH